MTIFPDIPGQSEEASFSIHNPSDFDLPVTTAKLQKIIRLIEEGENASFAGIELVYVDEEHIVNINREYLKRDYVTDIITFRYDDWEKSEPTTDGIDGTLYCCAPRIAEQSREMDTEAIQEFYRIFIHGLLHLVGYNDSTTEEKFKMTQLENHYLEHSDLKL